MCVYSCMSVFDLRGLMRGKQWTLPSMGFVLEPFSLFHHAVIMAPPLTLFFQIFQIRRRLVLLASSLQRTLKARCIQNYPQLTLSIQLLMTYITYSSRTDSFKSHEGFACDGKIICGQEDKNDEMLHVMFTVV